MLCKCNSDDESKIQRVKVMCNAETGSGKFGCGSQLIGKFVLVYEYIIKY